MKLSTLEIKNLRGIVSQSICFWDYTTLIGQNNTGKSTVLRAIEILLDQQKPDEDEWNQAHVGESIEIAGRFTSVSERERDIPGIASLVYNGEIQLRVSVTMGEKGAELEYSAFIQEESITGWSEKWTELDPEIKALAEGLGIGSPTWKTKANQERIRQQIRVALPHRVERGEPGWSDAGISIKEALKQGIPRVEVIPAVRDASDEGYVTQRRNIFQEILERTVVPEVEATPEYRTILTSSEALSNRISADGDAGLQQTRAMTQEITDVAGEIIELQVLMRLGPTDIKKLLTSGARISLSDGIETPVEFQGHGAQRALIYALVRYIAKERARAGERIRPVILLFEEPEIYIHPQLLRALKSSLKLLSRMEGWQVVVTTHSPFMIDVADIPQSLAILRKTDKATGVNIHQLDRDPFDPGDGGVDERQMLRAALDFHPTVCEAFFAQHAVLVEGDSEVALFQFGRSVLNQVLERDFDTDRVSIVSCGGKWTILPIARLLKLFGIPVKIICDRDSKGRTAEQLANLPGFHPYNVNDRVLTVVGEDNVFFVEDTLEDILFTDPTEREDVDKPYRAWKRMKDILESGTLNTVPRVVEMIRFAYGS